MTTTTERAADGVKFLSVLLQRHAGDVMQALAAQGADPVAISKDILAAHSLIQGLNRSIGEADGDQKEETNSEKKPGQEV